MNQGVEEIFRAAREKAIAADRTAYLDAACGADFALRAKVEELLRADAEAGVPATGAHPRDLDATIVLSHGLPRETVHEPPTEKAGQMIGRYKLLQQIGEGGFGSVWMAEQREPVVRKVALKIIKLGMDTREVIARFEQERQALALTDHANIAKVLDAGATGTGRPFFVMELCPGDSITEYCDENNLSVPERLGLFIQVCQAVQHAHQKGLIHRDIKPSNILVSTQDGKPHAKVIDFGIAKATGSKLTERTLFTQHRQLVGTPHYMSPEQAEGSLDIDTRTDVYSLGVLLYELLTGTTPFDSRSLQAATIVDLPRIIREIEPPHPSSRVRSMISGMVPPPSSDAATAVRDAATAVREADSPGRRAGWSLDRIAAHRRIEPRKLMAAIRGELDWIVMKAMEKDRTRRYETANALAADIEHHLHNEPVTASPPSTRYLLSKFVRRNRKGVIAGAVIASALVLGTIGTTVGMLWAINEKARATLAADTAERAAYQAQLLSAAHAIEDQRMDAAGALLAATVPRFRGWEYRHLQSRLDRSLPSPFPADWRIYDLARSTGAADVAVLRMAKDGRTREWVVLDHDLRSERLVVPGIHVGPFAVSPDGTRAIWATPRLDPRAFTLWDIGARRALAIVPMAPTPAAAEPSILLTWSPSGERFLVSSMSGFEVRDGHSGALLRRAVVSGWAYWTADDRWIFVRGTGQDARFDWKKCRLFDSRSLAPQPSVLELASAAGGAPNLAFSQSRVAIAMQDGTVHVLEIVDGALHERSKLPGEGIAWSHDGRLIAVGSSVYSMSTQGEGRVRVWEADSGALHGDFAGPGSGVHLMFLPDSGDLLTLDGAGHHRVLPITSGSPGVLTAHRSFVYPLALTKDGGTLLTGGWDGMSGFSGGLKLWDARTGALVAEHGRPGEIFYSADLTPDGRYAVAGVRLDSGESLGSEVIDLATGEVRTTFRPTALSEPDHTIVHPDGRRVLSPYRSGETYLWDLVTGKVLWKTDLQRASVNRRAEGHGAAAISPDGRLLALAEEGISIRLVDANTFQDVRRWDAHADDIWSLSFSPDGKWLLSPSDDDTVGVWEVATGKPIARLVGHNADVLCAAMSPDGTRIASGGRDGYVRLWDTTHFDNVAQLGGHTSYVYSLAWSPDGRQLISSSGDHTVRIWDTRTLAEEVEATRARTEALPPLEARVARARAEAPDPRAGVATLIASQEFDARQRELLQQVAMRFALDGMPRYYRAPRAATPIVIDGRIDEAAWNASPWSEPFVDIEGDSKPKPRFETRMRMLWDDTYLYVAARLEEPHVWATLSKRDDIMYRDNDFEVFVDPEGDGRWYGEVEVNALGAVFDLLLDRPYYEGGRPHANWSPLGLRAAVSVDGTLNDPSDVDRGWTAEIAIPHAALADHATAPLPPRPGDVWRINFSRVQWQRHAVDGKYVNRHGTREDNWVWTPQHVVDMHRPREWGFVEFVRDPNDGQR